jgi:hypothetical protein
MPGPRHRRGQTIIDGGLAFVAILLIVQMWLLTASLEAHLGGHRGPVLAGAVASALLFACVAAVYRFVVRADREVRREEPEAAAATGPVRSRSVHASD